jgi:hypothetical protein
MDGRDERLSNTSEGSHTNGLMEFRSGRDV